VVDDEIEIHAALRVQSIFTALRAQGEDCLGTNRCRPKAVFECQFGRLRKGRGQARKGFSPHPLRPKFLAKQLSCGRRGPGEGGKKTRKSKNNLRGFLLPHQEVGLFQAMPRRCGAKNTLTVDKPRQVCSHHAKPAFTAPVARRLSF
jgi:hypothetical protein